jgi:hypothetical protein
VADFYDNHRGQFVKNDGGTMPFYDGYGVFLAFRH